ncbi:MAG: hypothetical protein EBT78_14115 [Betaproteobacteria bacterium]|nr:hypothetical protein [Betaproteobacteria bacterium]NBT68882.1 hypothetical protein [Betaproteobacteria bacterium]
MGFQNSHEYAVEEAIYDILLPINALLIASGDEGDLPINIYTQNRIGAKILPYITIACKTKDQITIPYSGIFEVEVEVALVHKASVADGDFTETFFNYMLGLLYDEDKTLQYKMAFVAEGVKIYMARISSIIPVIQTNRTNKWAVIITAYVTPDILANGIRFLDFSNRLNSQYLALV